MHVEYHTQQDSSKYPVTSGVGREIDGKDVKQIRRKHQDNRDDVQREHFWNALIFVTVYEFTNTESHHYTMCKYFNL
jgi:hypothetical protein